MKEESRDIFGYEEQLREKQRQNAACKECYDSGRIIQKDGTSMFCRCYLEKIWFARFKESGIPELYFDYDLSSWDSSRDGNNQDLTKNQVKKKQDIKNFIEKYIKFLRLLCGTPPQSLLFVRGHEKIKINSLKLVGGNGGGKTMLASIIATSANKTGLTVKYYEWTELVTLFSGFDYKAEQNEIVEDFRNKHIIIIDNISNISLKWPYLKLQLDRLAQARVKSGKPIILTFNGEYTEAESNSAWKNLIDSCYTIELPTATRSQK